MEGTGLTEYGTITKKIYQRRSMSEFFKAFNNYKFHEPKKYYINVLDEDITAVGDIKQNDSIEIDIPTYKKLKDQDLSNFKYIKGKIVAVLKKQTILWKEVRKSKDGKGFNLVDSNPYWIKPNTNTKEKIYTWTTK